MKTILSAIIISWCLCSLDKTNAQYIFADHNLNIIDSMACAMDSSCALFSVHSDSVNPDGTSLKWYYSFHSSKVFPPTNYFFHTDQSSVLYDSTNKIMSIGSTFITGKWINSDSAMMLAEHQGGAEFRSANPNYKITAYLGETFLPVTHPTWYIEYYSLDNSAVHLYLGFDATDRGDLIGVTAHDKIPCKFMLGQNYPNPFNPTTTIQYSIAKASLVTITVFDVLGEEVSILLNKEMPAGNYSVKFNAGNLSSGIYCYRIHAGNFNAAKKFVLLK